MASARRILLAAVFAVALPVIGARADITAATFSGSALFGPQSQAVGWRFRPTSDVSVTQLGVFGGGGAGGLSGAHTVGVFDVATHTLIASAVIPAGTGAALVDGSRFVSIAPVTLGANTQYYLLGDNFTVDMPLFAGGATYASGIQFLSQAVGDGPSIFANPTFPTGGFNGYLGPNFRFVVVPTPSVSGLGTLAAVVMWSRRRRS